ncbi:MAG: hypothetical protein HYU28_05520 [Actinobacteria bacterium]|nr:hypothetical protein [Actinomycetota bacterium]
MSELGTPASERESLLVVRNLLIALGVFVIGLLVAVTTRGDDPDSATRPTSSETGRNVDDFLREAERELEGLDGTHAAVVSFTRYLDESTAGDVVGLDVRRWLVAAPGGGPESVADVEDWRERAAAAAREEAAALDEIIPTAGDPEFVRQYERDRDRHLRIAEALEADEPVVFGVVVVAPAGVLRSLAEDPRVRLVDPDPEADEGLRPEEQVVRGEPKERP